jgi:predicted RNA-binding protein with PIN domain
VPILIDGHNLIGRLPTISLGDPDDEARLIQLLQSYQARTGKSVTVVFDPGWTFALSETRRYGGVKVIFARQGGSADAVILRRVRHSANPQGYLVVTSDLELARAVTSLGARVRDANAFAGELSLPGDESPGWKDTSLSDDEVEEWLALFGEQDREGAQGDSD